MRIGDMLFKWSADEMDEDTVPSIRMPEFESQEEVTQVTGPPEFEQQEESGGEDISTVPGVEFPEVPSSAIQIAPGMMKGLAAEDVLDLYDNPSNKELAENSLRTAENDPIGYLSSHSSRHMKDDFYNPITAWVLDNKIIENPDLTLRFFIQYNARSDEDFEPWVHEGIKYLIENDPLMLLGAEAMWGGGAASKNLNKMTSIMAPYLPAFFEAVVRVAESDEQGQLFRKDLDTQRKFQALGRIIGRAAKFSGNERMTDFFLNRVMQVLSTRIDIEQQKLKELKEKLMARGENPNKNPLYSKYRAMVQGWKNNLSRMHISLTGSSYRKSMLQLARIATTLDTRGEYELADEIDFILREAADPKYFVDLRPEEEREKDPSEKGWDPYGVFKELAKRPGELEERRYMIDPMFGLLEEAPEGKFVEEELEPKEEEEINREKDVEELTEEHLAPEYLQEFKND